jgi:hypothetical protein
MPTLLDDERLAAGNALSSAVVEAGSLIGPAIGGTVVAAKRARRPKRAQASGPASRRTGRLRNRMYSPGSF